MRKPLIVCAMAGIAFPVLANDVPAEQARPLADIATVRAQNEEIIHGTPGSDGVFVVQTDGTIRHLQSGLVCPARYPNAEFWHALIYTSAAGKGLDVGCDYRRADDKGGADIKLSIFATKMPDNVTVDTAFAQYRAEVMQVWKDATPLGPALRVTNRDSASPPLDIRSEEYSVRLNERGYTSDLIVTISHGWTIEIRSTFSGKPNTIEVTKEDGKEAATLAVADRAIAGKALFDALGTIGN